ncbi:MAG: adenylate/guanylate cyclase domain-containing protein [Thiohalocapsa sp.]
MPTSRVKEAPVERRLAAILAADVVGYSRLMGADEVGTLRRLRACRSEVIDPAIAARRGRIVKTTGDGLLVEFASAVDAVSCAIAAQQAMAARSAGEPDERRLIFRIGINVGDIIIEAGDIFGDGVNVAARLEALAPPGGLCISRAVRDQVRDKLAVQFDDLGEQEVKNIARPVRAFALMPEAIAAAPDLALAETPESAPRRRQATLLALLIAVLIATAGGLWLWQHRSGLRDSRAPAASTPAAGPRASIAVLPFTALSADSGRDYFADGLTEDIIGALGRFRELSVIAPAAVFAYKGKNPTPAEVGHDLKVRYVVDGSVRRSGDAIRIAVNLTDAMRSRVLWSDKYDAGTKDIFAVQDRITHRISGALALRLTSLEEARSAAKHADNMEAYDLVLRGRALSSHATRADNARARSLFERAMELDPNYAPAYVALGSTEIAAVTQGWTPNPSDSLKRAESLARKALALDDLDPRAHALLANAALYFGEYDRALAEVKRAIALNGSDAQGYEILMDVLLFRGDVTGAIAAGETLTQVEPELPNGAALHLAMAYVLADRGADAAALLEHTLDRTPGYLFAHVVLAAAYAEAGRQQEAERQAAEVRRRFPNFLADEFGSLLRDQTQRDKLAASLKKAGL